MSLLVYYLMIHLCVSMHACNSRPHGVFHKEPEKAVYPTKKAPGMVVGIEVRNVYENNMELKESKLELFPNEQNMHADNDLMMFAGNGLKVQISQEGTKIEGWKNRLRLTMESKQKDSKEKINDSKDNSLTEDVGVMDYAQPHRKPPIHNLVP